MKTAKFSHRHILRFLITILAFWGYCPAEKSIYVTISEAFPSASPVVIILIGVAIILIVGSLVLWEILKSEKKQKERQELSWQNFSESCKAKTLSTYETDLLRKMIIAGKLDKADIVFQAPAVYEKCLDAFIKKSEIKKKPDIPWDWLTRLRDKLGYSRLPVETHLTSTRQLHIGQKLNVKLQNTQDNLPSQIADLSEALWVLELPPGVILQVGDIIFIWFIRGGDAEYSLSTVVTKYYDNKAVLEHRLKMERKQLRNWVRIDVNLPCRAILTMVPDQEDNSETPPLQRGAALEGRIMDISGGGVCLRLDNKIPQNSILSLSFDLPGSSIRGIRADVLGYNQGQGENDNVIVHRLRFKDIETSLQEKIVRFVFEKSRMDSQFRA